MKHYKISVPKLGMQQMSELEQRLQASGLQPRTEGGQESPPMFMSTQEGGKEVKQEAIEAIVSEYGGTIETRDDE